MRANRSWRHALRRGTILGSVVSIHLLLLALVMGPSTFHWSYRDTETSRDVLQVDFIVPLRPSPKVSLHHDHRSTRSHRAPVIVQRHKAVVKHENRASKPFLDLHLNMVLPERAESSATTDGGFSSALQAASRTKPLRIPGSDVAIVQGINLQPVQSIQTTLLGLGKAMRCRSIARARTLPLSEKIEDHITPQELNKASDEAGCGTD